MNASKLTRSQNYRQIVAQKFIRRSYSRGGELPSNSCSARMAESSIPFGASRSGALLSRFITLAGMRSVF